jgi:L-alanine-DL-glutamate epimerase-like enolase superfamily enzyme
MKITGITVYEYDAAWVHGAYGMSHGRLSGSHRSLVVCVSTDEGLDGWAETCPNGRTYLPSFVEGERAALAVLAPAITGLDPRNLSLLNQTMDETLLGSNAAKAVIDMACWDILGKAVGLPVCELLGGRLQDTFPLFVAVPIDTPEAMAARTELDYAAGIRVFQVKVGDDPASDVAGVRAVLEVAGSDCTVIADANGGWNLQSALLAAQALARLPVRLEQPCATMAECAELRKHTALPLILDECVITMDDLMRARYSAGAGGINLKPSRVGGLTKARALRDAAQGLRMTFTVDDTWGGALTTAQNAQLAASCNSENLTAATCFADWIESLVSSVPTRHVPGRGVASTDPGLGVSVDTGMLESP